MRAFMGIELNKQHKIKIEEYRQEFRNYAERGRWRHTNNLHITLKFFDEISQAEKLDLDEIIESICKGFEPFRLEFDKVGVFPGKDIIRTLWLGVGGDVLHLQNLQKAIEKGVGQVGFAQEKRRYTPHITLGQEIQFSRNFDELKDLIGPPNLPPLNVDRFYLFKSEQVGNKRIYTKISEFLLK